ncbi:MAG: linalool dehydratase/isomerase domain-containing protein [Candidatus Thorarchaeota archaeon]
MSQILRHNKFVVTALVITIVFAGMTFGNLPPPPTTMSSQTINGTTFNFADYKSLTREQLGIFNYFDRLTTNQAYNEFEGWYTDGWLIGWRHYFTAFLTYFMSTLFETTPGYRTSQYEDFTYTLIKKMNTTMEGYDNDSIEYWEWGRTSYPDYYFPDPTNSSGVYTGGYRGPANIMWTGHYALMLALYERNFNTGDMTDELTWYVEDWNNSLTTDGMGNPKEGGIWGVGLIPCEPQFVFVNCNSIPIFATELYDNLYSEGYMESGMWEYGLTYLNNTMQDEHDLFSYVAVVSPTLGADEDPDTVYPYVSNDDLGPVVSGYGTSWALMFLEYTQESETIKDYPVFLDIYGRDVSNDQMYVAGSYRYPEQFADITSVLGSLFTLPLANQRGDQRTVDRLWNFWLGSSNAVWSSDNRALHYEGSMASVIKALEPVLTGLCTWGTIPTTTRDLADARSSDFWNTPYISSADDDSIWVYQAEWDSVKEGFILNIEVDQTATLTFSNFDSLPIAYRGGSQFAQLEAAGGGDYTISLEPGLYHLVLM